MQQGADGPRGMTAPFRSPTVPAPAAGSTRLQRAYGRSRVTFRRDGGETRLADLWQEGCAKVRLPKVHDGRGPVAVLINTAGGITGGDVLDISAGWEPGARATVTAQAAERIYRRSEGVGQVSTRLDLAGGSRGAWLPQETIVFDGAGLDRTLEVSLAPDAVFTGCEAIVLGRAAMGETVRRLDLVDRWRIRRGGRLAFADVLRLRGDPQAILSSPATGGGATAFATVVHAAPDAEARVDGLRSVLDNLVGEDVDAGCSAFDGLLVARVLARHGQALRQTLEPLLVHLLDGPLPRVWSL